MKNLICKLPHCKCMNLDGKCINHHYQDSCFDNSFKPHSGIVGLEEQNFSHKWREEFNKQFELYQGEYEDLISAPKGMIKQFISELRKNDETELINKLLSYISNNNKNGWEFLGDNVKQLIKEYFSK